MGVPSKMREFPGRYPKPRHPVPVEIVAQALADHDFETAAMGIATAVWQLSEGNLDIPLPQIDAWTAALPTPWSQEPEIRLLSCWELINKGDYTRAVLILEELARHWKGQVDGPDRELAIQWLHYICSAQGILYDRTGQRELARHAFTEAHRFLPKASTSVIRPAAALEIDAEEASQLLATDEIGLCPLLIDGLTVYQQNGDRQTLARVAHNIGECYLEQGRLPGARYWLERAWELKKANTSRLPLLFTLSSLGVCYRRLGLLDEAQSLLDNILVVANEIGSLFHQAHALSDLGSVHRDRENAHLALQLYHRAMELKERLHDGFGTAQTSLSMATLYRRQGQYSSAGIFLAQARRQGHGYSDQVFRQTLMLHTQINDLLQGREPATEEMGSVVQRLSDLHAYRQETLGHWYLALACRGAGNEKEALMEAEKALRMAMSHGHLRLLAMELSVSAPVLALAINHGLLPEAVVGIVQKATPGCLDALLERVPSARSLVAATGRLAEVQGLTAKLLGGFHLFRAGREVPLTSIRSQKAISLLKLLVAKRNQIVSREQIFDIIWPEVEIEAADRSFDVTLSALRKLLESSGDPPLIIRRGRGYTINPELPLTVDAEEFVRHWEKGHWWGTRGQVTAAAMAWRAAEDLYAGDFLADDLYEDWATAERENLREKYLELLVRIGEVALTERRYDLAIDRARRVLAVDPLRETAYRLLMKAHAALGDRAVALRDYRRCEEVLRRELGEEPMAETRELAQRIRNGQGL